MPHKKVRSVRKKLRKKRAKRKARKLKRKRKIRRKTKPAKEEAKATKEELSGLKDDLAKGSKTVKGAKTAARAAKRGGKAVKKGGRTVVGGAAAALDQVEAPEQGGGQRDGAGNTGGGRAPQPASNRSVVPEGEQFFTESADAYVNATGDIFDDFEVADTDGVVEPKDIRGIVDIDGDGEIDQGEKFRPTSAPKEADDVPVPEDPDGMFADFLTSNKGGADNGLNDILE